MNKFFTFFRETGPARFLIPVGIITLIFSIFVFKAVDHTKEFIKVESVVTKSELYEEAYHDANGDYHEETYDVWVKYTVDGKEYETEYGIFTGYKVGDKITISYNPKDPTEISQPTSIILPIVLSVAGLAALIGGIISLVKAINKQKAMKEQERSWENGN